jgi:outer membrane protein
MRHKIATLALGIALALAATGAHADNSYPNDIRIGAYLLHFDSTASDITGPYTVAGLNTRIASTATLYLAYVRQFSRHFQLELAMGWPPVTYAKAVGPAFVGSVPYNGKSIASVRWFSPTALLEYSFFSPQSHWRPFVGIGVNYTRFFSRQITAAGAAVSGGPTSISLPSSVGPAATAGVLYRLSDRWHVVASYSVAQVNSRLTTDTAGVHRSSEVHFWPNAVVVSVGYSF